MASHDQQSHTPQIVTVIVTGVMCFIAGVLSSDLLNLVTSKMSADQVRAEKTIAGSKTAEAAPAPAAARLDLALIEAIDGKSSDPVMQRAYSLFAEGVRLQKAGEHSDAVNKYIAVTELDPGMSAAFNNMAVAYVALQSPEQAMASLNKAADISPSNETARKNADALNAWMQTGRQ